MKNIFLTTVLAALFLTSCGYTPQADDNTFSVLTSTTILADIAQNVAGDRVQVKSLLPYGTDPHAYQAAPSDAAKIAESDLLIINGLEYEGFIQSLIENAGGQTLTIEATNGLKSHQFEGGLGDPHMWLDPNLVITYVENIRDGLIQADPEGAETYTANASAYISQLKDLDTWIQEQVNTIPPEKRLLVTNHEAFGYFADRYGFQIVDTIIPSLSSEAGTSAQGLADVIDAVRAANVPAIFLSETENTDLANQIAEETGVKIINNLHFESLTNGAPAGTYIEMMEHNVMRITEALK